MKKPFENAGQQFDAENSSQKDAFEEAQAQVLGPTSNYRAPSDQADEPEKLRLASPADMGSAARRTHMKKREAPPRGQADEAPYADKTVIYPSGMAVANTFRGPMYRYRNALQALPPSGGGGCHPALLGVANLGARAGLSRDQMFQDIRNSVTGRREVSDREILDAIDKAFSETSASITSPHKPRWTPKLGPQIGGTAARQAIIERGRGATFDSIRAASPVAIPEDDGDAAAMTLLTLYSKEELVFAGEDATPGTLGESIRSVDEWVSLALIDGPVFPKVMPNPLSGLTGLTKDGRPSLRADSCVSTFRFVVCEFDSICLEDQLAFWSAAKLPICALIYSAKKSVHAWVRADCIDAAEWEEKVENWLFPSFLKPLGLDGSCRNESRLSRMPGHLREDTQKVQQLLYLAPKGRPIHAT